MGFEPIRYGMLEGVAARVVRIVRRLRRIEQRELAEFGRWIENTENLLHLSVLVLLPLLLGFVTVVSNATDALPYLLFPPLASGSYMLFSNPESESASPRRFVGGLTVGALCGWLALALVARYWYSVPPTQLSVHPGAVALGIFLTSAVTWALDMEEASAFSTALLVHVTGTAQLLYVGSVLASTSLVAVIFYVWRERFYERRARYLYGTVTADDHVLIPMREATDQRTALFGARLAAAHDAGKVVLLGFADEEMVADENAGTDAESLQEDGSERADSTETLAPEGTELAKQLESLAARVRTWADVPCEVVVASGDPVTTTIETARGSNCDLIVTPYEKDRGGLSNYVRGVFDSPFDAVAFRSTRKSDRWRRVLVTVARPGDTAHAMIDFATRLVDQIGTVSVCTCISNEVERRRAEQRLATLVETVNGRTETRVARGDVEDFIEANAGAYDVVVIGSSRDRSAASRFVSPPTFERIRDVETDIAVVDRGRAE